MKKIFYSLLLLTACSVSAQTPVQIAGTGITGYNGNGLPALSTELNNPTGLAVDKKGYLYYSDADNNIIRKIDAAGNIVTVAGDLIDGYNGDGIVATAAELSIPAAITFDSAGNLYIADQGNDLIRKVDTFGIITTVAGGGTSGLGDGGPATAAELNGPSGVIFDTAGNMYCTDQSGHRVRKVDSKGIITTIAGNGTFGYSGDNGAATNAELSGPYGINFDKAGNMYIADVANGTIRKIDPAGIITTSAGTGAPGYNGDGIAATTAELSSPEGVAIDGAGNIYIADGANARIRVVNTNGIISTLVSDTGKIAIPNLGFETAIYGSACTNMYFIDGSNANIWELPDTQILSISITPQSPLVCNGQSVTLYVSGGTTYAWSPVSGLSATTGDSVVANPSLTVTYTVTSSLSGCKSMDTDVITIIPPPNKPVLTLSANGDTLISSANNGNEWFENDTVIKEDTTSKLILTGRAPGTYKVTVTDVANGCSATSDSVVITGINQVSINNNRVLIFPNPNNGEFTLLYHLTSSNAQLRIADITGRIIYEENLSAAQGTEQVAVPDLNNGLFFWQILSDNQLAAEGKITVIK